MHRTRPEALPRAELWILAALTAGAAALRAWQLGGPSLWYDEALTYHLVQGGWRDIVALNATGNSAPPLFPLLLGAVTGPAASEAALRAPALIAGVLAVPLIYALAREFITPRPALCAALLVAASPTLIEYSRQVREYSLTFLAAAALLLAFARYLREPSGRHALLFAVAAALGTGIQYGIGLLLVALNLVWCASLRLPAPRPALGPWVVSQLPAAGVAVALAVTTLPGQLAWAAQGRAGYLAERYWDGSWRGLQALLATPGADIVHFAYPGKLMLVLTAGGAIVACIRPPLRLAAASLLVPVALTVIAALAGLYPFGGVRQDMFLLPMIYVAAAIGLAAAVEALRPRLPSAALAAAALLIAAALAYRGLAFSFAQRDFEGIEPLRPAVGVLRSRLQPGEIIYVYSGAIPAFGYYWRGQAEPWQAGALHWSGLDESRAAAQMIVVQAELGALAGDGRPFWIVASHLSDRHRDQLLEPVRSRREVTLAAGAYGSWLYYVPPLPAS